jgi:flagellar basal-body rod protein FlgG
MLAQQLNVEVISNNIANMNTTSFKRQRAEFQDLLYQNMLQVGAASSDSGTVVPSGIQIGVGVHAGAVYRIVSQGDFITTSKDLDVAIKGRGFFQIELPNGQTAYSRAGSFQLSPSGEIVTASGYRVLPGITIQNAAEISINESGQVSYKQAGQIAPTIAGQLELAVFANEAGLEPLGDNLFLQSDASGAAAVANPGATGYGTMQQGFLEGSNVNPVNEITALIAAQRAYEMNSKVIETSDQMLSTITQLR